MTGCAGRRRLPSYVTSTHAVSRADVGLRSERGPVLLAVMLSVGLVAIDATVLATAVPAVVEDLGGFTQFPWLFSVYLLTQAVSVPLYSKLADQYGRKPMMLIGVGVFLLGSLLCGLAWNMGSLIAFRAVQGIGAGAVQPIGMTIVGDIYSVEERAKVQGYLAGVWAVVVRRRPDAGRGLLRLRCRGGGSSSSTCPIGLAALWMFARRFDEQVEPARAPARRARRGAAQRRRRRAAARPARGRRPVGLDLTGEHRALRRVRGRCSRVFVLVERRAAEPVLPLWVFRHRVILPAILISLVVGVLLIGLTSYIPLYAQGVLGHGAVMAGFALAALTLGWPLSAVERRSALPLHRLPARRWSSARCSGSPGRCCCSPSTATARCSTWRVPCFVMGIGFGFAVAPSVIAAQSAVGWESRARHDRRDDVRPDGRQRRGGRRASERW